MAEEQRTILIDIEVEDRNFDQELANVNSQLRKNREEIKELSKDYEENAEEIAKLELANKELSASKREITKASQTEANSLNALRLRLANLTKERNNLDTSIEGNVERFNQLQKEIKSTSDEIKGFEEAGGDFRRNVGNYTDSVGEAVSETQFFGVSVNDLGAVFTSTTALIGAAVGVLSGLVKAYASSARGAEDLQRATDRLNEVYNTFSQTLADTFGGDGEGGILDKALDFVLQRTTSVTTQVRAEIATSAAAALRELEVLEIQEERDAKQRLQRAEQLRQIRDDETSGINERIKANEELFNVISVREQAIIDFQNRRLQQLQLQLRLDPENLELRKEILRTEFEIADIQEESEGFRSEALINRVSLNKELLELTERRQLIELEARDARIQDIEISDQELEARQNLEIFRLEQQEKLRDAELIRREQLLENEELTESQRQLIIERSEQRILDIKKDATKKEVDLAKKRSDQIA
ncbi:MAG: hypothetical protein HRU26_12530, partial [Psychroserpens sp.]|nr:hypothetical protein [Psychroserpens sp.]